MAETEHVFALLPAKKPITRIKRRSFDTKAFTSVLGSSIRLRGQTRVAQEAPKRYANQPMRGRTRYKIVKQAHTQIQRRHMVEKTEAHRKIEIGADCIAQTT